MAVLPRPETLTSLGISMQSLRSWSVIEACTRAQTGLTPETAPWWQDALITPTSSVSDEEATDDQHDVLGAAAAGADDDGDDADLQNAAVLHGQQQASMANQPRLLLSKVAISLSAALPQPANITNRLMDHQLEELLGMEVAAAVAAVMKSPA